jgi:hypothetical protein
VTRYQSAAVLACFVSLFFIGSCSKIDTTDLGNELIPAVDNITTFETVLNIITDNKLFNDTTRMLDDEDHGVGIIDNDPEFGRTVAATYASFTPATFRSYPFVKKDTVVIDSVVLSLAYTSVYGDSNSIQEFQVKEIDGRFEPRLRDSLYYLNAPDFPTRPDVIGLSNTHFLSLNDSVVYKNAKDTVRTSSELRIMLDTAWARKFVNYDTTNAYQSDTNFLQDFPGLQIMATESSPSKTAIAYFNLSDADRTKLTFYCRVQNNGRTDTIAPSFGYNSGRHANIIRRTPANNYLSTINNAVPNDEVLYIQTTPGSYTTVEVPGLDTFQNTNRLIHRAELIFEKYPSNDGFFGPPPYLFVEAVSTTGDSAFTIRNDFVPVQSTPGYDLNALGGVYRNNQYVFNLSRYIQSIVTKKFTSYKLRVFAPFATQPYYIPEYAEVPSGKIGIILNTPVASGRVVLYGGGSLDPKHARLRIIYSKI